MMEFTITTKNKEIMKTIKTEILQIITAFKLGTFQSSATTNTNFADQYTET